MIRDLILKNRSFRRYCQDYEVSIDTLKELVDLARLAGSSGNRQSLKYLLINDPLKNTIIFSTVFSWATLVEANRPKSEEKPAAFIIILGDKEISEFFGCDYGIAAQNILLGAVEKGLGGCMLAGIDKDALRKSLNIPARFEILLVVALGKPDETIILESLEPGSDTHYWVDRNKVNHVPKRSLEEIIVDF
jgi:nitroreductase